MAIRTGISFRVALVLQRPQRHLPSTLKGSRFEYAMMMDLREAKACVEQYRISLANISGMLKPNVAEGELREAIGKLNDSLIERLNAQVKDATILSIMICEEMNATREQVRDFPAEWADLLVALNQLKLATDTAALAQAEYLRKTADGNRGTELARVIGEFKRKDGLMTKEEIEEYDRKMSQEGSPNLVEISNTPDRTEVCAAAETDAPGNKDGTAIRFEPSHCRH